ncbi:hypothetical protein QE435_004976 [Rhizobium sp. SORGH_AS 787]|nr:hypothetical protein [Rhizobium sp. SORGH_AS_0787]
MALYGNNRRQVIVEQQFYDNLDHTDPQRQVTS